MAMQIECDTHTICVHHSVGVPPLQGYLSGMLFTIAQRGVLLVIEAPTKVINLLLRELHQRDLVYARAAAQHKVCLFVLPSRILKTVDQCSAHPSLTFISLFTLHGQIAVDAALEKAQRTAAAAGPSYAKPGSGPTQTAAAAPSVPTDALPQMPPTESPLLSGARILAMQEVRRHAVLLQSRKTISILSLSLFAFRLHWYFTCISNIWKIDNSQRAGGDAHIPPLFRATRARLGQARTRGLRARRRGQPRV